MKFFGSTVLAAVAASGISAADGMSIRGNTKSANKLMTFARKLEDNAGQGNNNNNVNYYNNGYYGGNAGNYGGNPNQGYGGYYGDMDEESMYFLRNYSIKLLGCIQGAQVINYENGEQESSSVIFRLCPTDTCSTYNELGCDSGYGDYVVGINTFLEAYMEGQDEENQGDNNNNNQNQDGNNQNQNQGGNYNNYNQNQGGNYYQNSMVAYSQYGQEFDAQEYFECREYDMEEGQEQQQANNGYNYNNGYNNYNNNQGQQQQGGDNQYNNNYYYYRDAKFYIGPGCSDDGKDIGLKMYMDEMCSYPASDVSFEDVSPGWQSLPFSDGGLVSMDCVSCYGPNENYDDWELKKMCTENYADSKSRCEENMESYSYYGGSTNGCEYIETLKSTVYTTNFTEWVDTATESTSKFMDRLSEDETIAFILGMAVVAVGAVALLLFCCCCCCKRRRTAKDEKAVALVNENEEEELDDVMKSRSGVLG